MNETQLELDLGEANTLIVAGEFAKAQVLLAEMTKTYPAAAKVWKGLGIAENKLGNHDTAISSLLRSLQLDDSDDDAWSSLGGAYLVMARYDDALGCFRRALSTSPASTYALVNYLTVASIIGDDRSALAEYSPALADGEGRCAEQIDQNANVPWCYYDLGQILFFEGRLDESRSAIRAAFERSNDWQVASARLPYERLAEGGRLAEPARGMLGEFIQHDLDRKQISGETESPSGGGVD